MSIEEIKTDWEANLRTDKEKLSLIEWLRLKESAPHTTTAVTPPLGEGGTD